MSDDIYDYFSGNAPKKVEPIEDDDLDPIDDQPQEASQETNDEIERAAAEISMTFESESISIESETVEITSTAQDQAESTPDIELANEGSHWDFLANELGIASSPPPAQVDRPSPALESPPQPEPEPAEMETAEKLSDEDAEVDPPAQPTTSIVFESETTKSNSEDDFFGFDPIPSPEDENPVLSSMFTPSADPEQFEDTNSDADESDEEYLEFEIVELDDSPLDPAEEAAYGRRSRRKSRTENEDEQETESSGRRNRKRKGKRKDRDSETSGKRKRSSEREDSANVDEADSESKEFYVDEIGWEIPVESTGQEETSNESSEKERSSRQEDSRSDSRGKRRRGRDRGRERKKSPPKSEARETQSEFDDGLDNDQDEEFRQPRRERKSRERTSSSRRSGRKESIQEDGDDQGKRTKFPTWEEAISGLIESNIKNHNKGSRGRGGRGRGRNNRGRSK